MNRTFTKSYLALAGIIGNLLVAFADPANSSEVAQATGAGSPLMGTSDRLDTALGDMCDVNRGGIPEVRLGGTVVAGDPLTSDADGKAVKGNLTNARHGPSKSAKPVCHRMHRWPECIRSSFLS